MGLSLLDLLDAQIAGGLEPEELSGGPLAEAFEEGLGMGGPPIEPFANDFEFVTNHRLAIDGQPYDFTGWDGYTHLVQVYADTARWMVIQAGAQTGKTGTMISRATRLAMVHYGLMFAYYFPDLSLADAFSAERFKKFCESNPRFAQILGRREDDSNGVNNVRRRSLGKSTIFFTTTRGVSSTESFPFKGVVFDEVRRMSMGDIERAERRLDAQEKPYNLKVSTARFPDNDINKFYLEGTQTRFHSDCACPDGVVLADTWPACIADLTNADPAYINKVKHAFSHAGIPYLGMDDEERSQFGEACYVCPTCGTIITNPRDGWWAEQYPDRFVHSYHMPQCLSPRQPAAKMWRYFNTTRDIDEFYRSGLGKPYLDPNSIPVHPEHLESCRDNNLPWPLTMGAEWERKNRWYFTNTCLGMDAMGGYCCITIKKKRSDGKNQLLHIEVAHDNPAGGGTGKNDPWRRAAELMVKFDVQCAVIDCNPHWNEARRFAQLFPGRVFLASYGDVASDDGSGDMVQWGDRIKLPQDQKGEDGALDTLVRVSRTKALKWSLKFWEQRRNVTPNPDRLLQLLPVDGKGEVVLSPGLARGIWGPVSICRKVYWKHQMHVAFVKGYANDDAQRVGDLRIRAEHIGGIDPHFAHASLYCDLACDRVGIPPEW